MKTSFELITAKALIHYTPRREIHVEDPTPAATLAITTTLPGTELIMFAPTLRWSLFQPVDGQTDVYAKRYPEIETAIKWTKEIVGGLLTIHNGIGGASDIRLPVAKADKFEILPLDGGMFELSLRIACHPDERQHGALAMKQDTECEVSFEPPAADLVEQAQAPNDKPLNTVGEKQNGTKRPRRTTPVDSQIGAH